MKQTLIFVILIFSFSLLFASQPDWYRKLSQKDFEIIGYGSSKDLEEARSMAKKEIANSIQAQIISENIFETSEINSVVSEKANLYLAAKTDVVLSDLKTIKEEQKKKVWYVALCYDNLPIEKKFAQKVSLSKHKSENQNKYFIKSPLIQSINEELNCILDIKLKRKNKIWYLAYGNVMLPLCPDEFEKLFISYESENISIIPSKSSVLTEGDVFSFSIESKKNGYLSIINVYEDGECFIITSNQPVMTNQLISIPDKSSDNELIAGLFTEKQPTYDLYVALFDNKEINLSRLQTAGSKIEKEEWHYKFNEVLEMMNEYEFCTVLIRTRPKM
ncbi:MAG: hypothetical protein RAP70_03170 [Candidatus Celaenobacter antarcticus]|nr:hypothetical protein [Candidatus Celaenobacter antarcticus]